MVGSIFAGLTALASLIAGILWVQACRSEVPAPSNTAGVGGLIGGYLIGLNSKKQRIDLIGTYEAQSKWNSWAAAATATAAFCASVSFIAQLMHW